MESPSAPPGEESTPGLADKQWQMLQGLLLASQREQRRSRRWSVFFKLLTFAYIGFAIALTAPLWSDRGPFGGEHVAVVKVSGIIADGRDASAAAVNSGLRRAFESDALAVLLSIDSPGGSPVQADQVFREIKRLRAGSDKPVIAVIGDMGASGAYYIAAAADEIYADRASLVGSIGVISAGFGFVGILEKLGLERRVFTAGSHKAMLDAFSPLKPSEEAFWSDVLAQTHGQFVARVKEGRGDRLVDDESLFSGLIWPGEQAKELGLVDGFASVRELARDRFGVEVLRDYTPARAPLKQLLSTMASGVTQALVEAASYQPAGLR